MCNSKGKRQGILENKHPGCFLVVFHVASWWFPVASWVVLRGISWGFSKNVLKFDGSTLLEIIQSKRKKCSPTSWQLRDFFSHETRNSKLFFVFKKICREGRLQACKALDLTWSARPKFVFRPLGTSNSFLPKKAPRRGWMKLKGSHWFLRMEKYKVSNWKSWNWKYDFPEI